MFLTLVASLTAGYAVWSWICLELNVRRAARMNLPYVRLPIDSHNLPWMMVETFVWRIVDSLPFDWFSYPASIRYLRRGWHFREKARCHTSLGPIWALVSPVNINLHIADSDVIGQIFARRRDFVRPIINYKILEVFGPCISTADVNDWPRHRKALAAPFNESIMSFVWDEAIRQSDGLKESWTNPIAIATGVPSVQSDTRSISLNILAATGFRKSYDFVGSADQKNVERGDYRYALQTVLDNAIPLMLIPYRILMFPLMPSSWARIGQAGDSFKSYMVQMLDEELQAQRLGRPGSGGIMASFLHALDEYQANAANQGRLQATMAGVNKGLSVEEIFGNIYVINFAGHDTTANTLAFSMLLLANHPNIQDWVGEEVNHVIGPRGLERGSYEISFERLVRCRAILYETLRLYPPIMALPKGTDYRAQSIIIQGRELVIPPNTGTTLSVLACHTHPDTWLDPLTWKPSRWITQSADGEKLFSPPRNTFFPWSDGHQNCPGKKFAEVEFVAVLANLLHNTRLTIKRMEHESIHEAQRRVWETINDVNMEMLLRMKDADRVRIVCLPEEKKTLAASDPQT